MLKCFNQGGYVAISDAAVVLAIISNHNSKTRWGGGLFGASNLRCSYDQQYGIFINLITHSYYLLCRNHVQPSKKSHTSILTHNPKTM